MNLSALMVPHRFAPDGCEWVLTVLGICIDGGLPERTAGEPTTMRRIWDDYAEHVLYFAEAFKVPAELILATIATESSGKTDAVRLEPDYVSDETTPSRVSVGLMQTLITTARMVLRDPGLGRSFLLSASGSIQAGTAYLDHQGKVTGFDPPKVAAAYNAGGLYYQGGKSNRWKMKQYPIGTGEHVDRWVRWFGDAMAVLRESGTTPNGSFVAML